MTTLTRNDRAPIRALPGPVRVQECDECRKVAGVYATGRDRRLPDRVKPEYMCEACIARLSTHDDPFGVMEAA